jgi:hypothetical protein
MRLGAPPEVGLRHGAAEPSLVAVEAREAEGALLFAQRREGKQEAVVAIACDLCRRQRLHGFLRNPVVLGMVAAAPARFQAAISRVEALIWPGSATHEPSCKCARGNRRPSLGRHDDATYPMDPSRPASRLGGVQGFSRSRWPICDPFARRLGQFPRRGTRVGTILGRVARSQAVRRKHGACDG